MDDLELAVIKPIDITDVGWKKFTEHNHGNFVLYTSHYDQQIRAIARVTIPNLEDGSQRFLECQIHWMIERFPKNEGGDDLKIGDQSVSKEDFIFSLSERYPEDLTWLLFHPEWLSN